MFGTGLGHFFPILVYLVSVFGAILSIARPITGVYILALILPLQGGRMRVVEYPLGAHILELLLLGIFIGLVMKGESILPPKPVRLVVLALCGVTYLTLWIGPALMPAVPWPVHTSDETGMHTPFGYWVMFMHMPAVLVAVCATVKKKQ